MAGAQAAVLTKPETFEFRELPLPETTARDGLLAVEANGLCGTDYEQFRGHLAIGQFGRMPIIPGHEIVGRIARIGREASSAWGVVEGDRVCVKATLPCGHCSECRNGASRRCKRGMGYGLFLTTDVAPGLWGGYATHMYLHPDSEVHRVPDDIDSDVMTLFNPLSGVVRWLYEVPNLRYGENVVILGPGQRGILAALTAAEVGASNVIVTGLAQDRARLDMARRLGATATIDVSEEDAVERVRELTGGRMADVVLDMSAGDPRPIVDAVEMAQPGGRIVLAGLKSGQPIEGLVTDRIVVKELQLFGVLSSTTSALERSLDILERRKIDLKPLCTHVYPLERVEHAVRVLGREVEDGPPVMHVNLAMDVGGAG
ncbi:MAG: alcohol dehydrogenase catalytic domain-containing protein [Hyphomicrobiales bacterium]|nr:alcohol dehydrogenase catalytic domain-containing protein [Hyphomicrobiales bacterium]